MLWHIIAQNLHRPVYTGRGGHSRTSRPTQVRVVEISQPVLRGAGLAAQAFVIPFQARHLCTHAAQQRTNGFSVPDDDAIGSARFFRFSGNS